MENDMTMFRLKLAVVILERNAPDQSEFNHVDRAMGEYSVSFLALQSVESWLQFLKQKPRSQD